MFECLECKYIGDGKTINFTCIPHTDVCFCEKCFKFNQPERLNPRDHIEDKLEMICDSPNSENK